MDLKNALNIIRNSGSPSEAHATVRDAAEPAGQIQTSISADRRPSRLLDEGYCTAVISGSLNTSLQSRAQAAL